MKKAPVPAWLAQTQCIGKHRFDDGNIARQVAQRQARNKDLKSCAYRCATCGGWHVGSGRVMKNNPGKK